MSTCKRMWTDREIRSMAVNSVENKSDLKVFEHIVDKDGHKRFIEGDITIETITGLAQSYGKWSLSGSHLMIVIAGSIENATTLSGTIAKVTLPEWIFEKVSPVSPLGRVANPTTSLFDDANNIQSMGVALDKKTDYLAIIAAVTTTAKRYYRVEFDLLIDNE